MAFYQEQSGWGAPAPARQASWEQQQQAPPSRSGTTQVDWHKRITEKELADARAGANSVAAREDNLAFHAQIDEVDRAIDNLVKSGKFPFMTPARRDSMPLGAGRPFVDFGTLTQSASNSSGIC